MTDDNQSLEQRAEQLAHKWSLGEREIFRQGMKAEILSALQSAAHRQDAEIEKLRSDAALALKARDHYDEERRESYRQMCGWKGLAEKLQAEVQSAAHRQDDVQILSDLIRWAPECPNAEGKAEIRGLVNRAKAMLDRWQAAEHRQEAEVETCKAEISRLRQIADTNFRVGEALRSERDQLEAEVEKLRQEQARVRALLNPNCAEETIEGAIRNLQQSHLSEKGNCEFLEAEVEKLRQENESLKFDVQELKESFGDMTEVASTAESSLAAVKQENAQFRAAMASCSGCVETARAKAAEAELEKLKAELQSAEHRGRGEGLRELVEAAPKFARMLRLDASGEQGRMSATSMYKLAEMLEGLHSRAKGVDKRDKAHATEVDYDDLPADIKAIVDAKAKSRAEGVSPPLTPQQNAELQAEAESVIAKIRAEGASPEGE